MACSSARMRSLLTALLVACSMAGPTPAAAQNEVFSDDEPVAAPEDRESTRAPDPSKRRWYGWQTLLVDGGTIVLSTAGLVPIGLGTYAFGPPIVHAANGNPNGMAASLGVRLLGPVVAATTGYGLGKIACSDGRDSSDVLGCPPFFGIVGFFVGMVGAVAVDASVIARAPPPRSPSVDDTPTPMAPPTQTYGLRVVPVVAPGARAMTIGAGGVF